MRQLYSKVVATTIYVSDWDNLQAGDELDLELEPTNPHDPHAIKVYHVPMNGDQVDLRAQGHIGYLNRWLAGDLAPQLAGGEVGYRCHISEITGQGKANQGINITLTLADIDGGDDDGST